MPAKSGRVHDETFEKQLLFPPSTCSYPTSCSIRFAEVSRLYSSITYRFSPFFSRTFVVVISCLVDKSIILSRQTDLLYIEHGQKEKKQNTNDRLKMIGIRMALRKEQRMIRNAVFARQTVKNLL